MPSAGLSLMSFSWSDLSRWKAFLLDLIFFNIAHILYTSQWSILHCCSFYALPRPCLWIFTSGVFSFWIQYGISDKIVWFLEIIIICKMQVGEDARWSSFSQNCGLVSVDWVYIVDRGLAQWLILDNYRYWLDSNGTNNEKGCESVIPAVINTNSG
jgi:hypothetical protein